MGIFDTLGQNSPLPSPQRQPGNPAQFRQAMQQELGVIKANPGEYLKQRGFNIPAGLTDAGQITRYLLQSGQVGNGRYQQIMRMIGGMK